MNLEERVERLEMELAHQQRTTDRLGEVIAQQSLEMLRMHRTVEKVCKQLEELTLAVHHREETRRDITEDKPPHY